MRIGTASIHLIATAALLGALGCDPAPPPPPPPAPDAGPDGDAGPEEARPEVEPNNGAEVDETDTLLVDERVSGAISVPGDVDIFALQTSPGRVYRLHLSLPEGSALEGHLTVLDGGRDGEAAGRDYIQLSQTGVESNVNLEFMAMGAGHLVIVRDARDVAGNPSGGDAHTWELAVEEIEAATFATEVSPPQTVSDALSHPGGMKAYRFSANNGDDALFEFSTTGDIDGRFFVVATETGDWIARNDDSGPAERNPRIDAPLFATGEMFLVVDNIQVDAVDLSYSLTLALP